MARAPKKPTSKPLEAVIAEINQPPGYIPTTNTPLDAPTYYVDAVQGVMVSEFTAKVFFIEYWVPSGKTDKEKIGRYACAIATPTPQLRAMGELFVRMADEVDKQRDADGGQSET